MQPDNPAWAPILLTFAITGLPMAGKLAHVRAQEVYVSAQNRFTLINTSPSSPLL